MVNGIGFYHDNWFAMLIWMEIILVLNRKVSWKWTWIKNGNVWFVLKIECWICMVLETLNELEMVCVWIYVMIHDLMEPRFLCKQIQVNIWFCYFKSIWMS